jgi:cation-transporting P-type ATPase 13A2
MIITLLFSTYMLLDPTKWLENAMELTPMSGSFKTFILCLAAAGFVASYVGERLVFPRLAKHITRCRKGVWGFQKKRKQYKQILEDKGS